MEKYLIIGLVILGLFLFGCAGTSGTTGTTNTSGVSGTTTQTSSGCGLTLQELKDKCVETCKNTTSKEQNDFAAYNTSMTINITEAEATLTELNDIVAQLKKNVTELKNNQDPNCYTDALNNCTLKEWNEQQRLWLQIGDVESDIRQGEDYINQTQKSINIAKTQVADKEATISNNNKKCLEKCDNLSETDLIEPRNSCYIRLAGETKDASYCEKVTGETKEEADYDKDGCYIHFAVDIMNDPAYCDRIKDGRAKDDCFAQIAEMKYDESICNRISSTVKRGECILSIK